MKLVPCVLAALSAGWVSTCLPRRPPYAEVDPSDMTSIVIANESNDRICSVHLTVADARRWGPDLLGDRELLDPGHERAFDVPPGSYDVRLEDCGHDPMMERRRLVVPPEGTRLVFRVREPDPADDDEDDDERARSVDAGMADSTATTPTAPAPSEGASTEGIETAR